MRRGHQQIACQCPESRIKMKINGWGDGIRPPASAETANTYAKMNVRERKNSDIVSFVILGDSGSGLVEGL